MRALGPAGWPAESGCDRRRGCRPASQPANQPTNRPARRTRRSDSRTGRQEEAQTPINSSLIRRQLITAHSAFGRSKPSSWAPGGQSNAIELGANCLLGAAASDTWKVLKWRPARGGLIIRTLLLACERRRPRLWLHETRPAHKGADLLALREHTGVWALRQPASCAQHR